MDNLNLAPARLRYSLAKVCPCGKSNKDGKFSPDKENPEFGHCHSCDKTFFQKLEQAFVLPKQQEPEKIDFISTAITEKSCSAYDKNNFILFAKTLFPIANLENKAKEFGIGTSKHWPGSTVFFQIDKNGNTRGGKIMLYDPKSGKRVKEPFSHFTWIHKVLKYPTFNLSQCLFGLQQLKDNTKPVAIVESEKTAFIMALTDDTYNWLATGGKGNFKYEILEAVKDRKIIAFPDKGEFKMWFDISERLKEFGFDIIVSDKMEKGNLPTGTDLADLLINERQTENTSKEPPIKVQPSELLIIEVSDNFSDNELKELAGLIIPEQDTVTKPDFIRALGTIEGLSRVDAENLIKVMKYRDIVDSFNGNFYLAHSTPF